MFGCVGSPEKLIKRCRISKRFLPVCSALPKKRDACEMSDFCSEAEEICNLLMAKTVLILRVFVFQAARLMFSKLSAPFINKN